MHWSILSRTARQILFLFTTLAHPLGEHFFANVAQLEEQLIRNQQVSGSNPLVGSQGRRFSFGPFLVFKCLLGRQLDGCNDKGDPR